MVRPDGTVHVQKIQVGRDYGDRLEVLNGLNEGDTVVQNPGDVVREGMKVEIAGSGVSGSALTFSFAVDALRPEQVHGYRQAEYHYD